MKAIASTSAAVTLPRHALPPTSDEVLDCLHAKPGFPLGTPQPISKIVESYEQEGVPASAVTPALGVAWAERYQRQQFHSHSFVIGARDLGRDGQPCVPALLDLTKSADDYALFHELAEAVMVAGSTKQMSEFVSLAGISSARLTGYGRQLVMNLIAEKADERMLKDSNVQAISLRSELLEQQPTIFLNGVRATLGASDATAMKWVDGWTRNEPCLVRRLPVRTTREKADYEAGSVFGLVTWSHHQLAEGHSERIHAVPQLWERLVTMAITGRGPWYQGKLYAQLHDRVCAVVGGLAEKTT